MAFYDYELELQSEIVSWKCSRHADCLMNFIPKPRHIKLGMSGLVWSIQALPRLETTGYTFNIMQVKKSRSPLTLCEDSTAPDLPAKFKLLFLGFQISISSVFRAEEALDELYAFSLLFSRAQQDKRWWIIADAEVAATACETTKEAIHHAAQAAASFLVESSEPPRSENRQKSTAGCWRSGWWIEGWTVRDELWAGSFYDQKGLNDMKQFQSTAVEEGNVLQWCSVQVSQTPNPSFEFEVAVEDFSGGDDVLLRIGVANDRALKVRVFLTENVKVECSQEGVKTATSLGLGYLLPDLARDYIKDSLNGDVDTSNNIVQRLLQLVVGYLAFLGKVCVVCGKDRLLDVPLTSCCSNICKARKQGYDAAITSSHLSNFKISGEGSVERREQYLRKLYSNSKAGRAGLGVLLKETVVEKEVEVGINCAAAPGSLFVYEEAVGRVARMDSKSIAGALGIQISKLWSADEDTV
ncbi:hypothetical protein KI387_000436 [Taxus chinensis]|uniref:Uncharacterized protein n=1 Tax=Taxus chinensis TaxID=29808 RepID=A0AA38GTE9_TAXCH|nr:hypothetical protein KI387_000436 [Taxus chinensis]